MKIKFIKTTKEPRKNGDAIITIKRVGGVTLSNKALELLFGNNDSVNIGLAKDEDAEEYYLAVGSEIGYPTKKKTSLHGGINFALKDAFSNVYKIKFKISEPITFEGNTLYKLVEQKKYSHQ